MAWSAEKGALQTHFSGTRSTGQLSLVFLFAYLIFCLALFSFFFRFLYSVTRILLVTFAWSTSFGVDSSSSYVNKSKLTLPKSAFPHYHQDETWDLQTRLFTGDHHACNVDRRQPWQAGCSYGKQASLSSQRKMCGTFLWKESQRFNVDLH